MGSLRGKERVPVDRTSPDPSGEEEMAPKIDLEAKLAEMAAKNKKAPPRKDKPSTGAVPGKVPAATEHKSVASLARVTISEDKRSAKKPRESVLINKEGKSIIDTDSVNADVRLGLALLPSLNLKNGLAQVLN